MKTTVRRLSVVVLLGLCSACGGPPSTAPSPAIQPLAPPVLPAPPPSPTFPPLAGPSRTFVFDHELTYSVSDYTRKSRFVLYDNGAFVLQYPSLPNPNPGYRGGYTNTNTSGAITFEWEG